MVRLLYDLSVSDAFIRQEPQTILKRLAVIGPVTLTTVLIGLAMHTYDLSADRLRGRRSLAAIQTTTTVKTTR